MFYNSIRSTSKEHKLSKSLNPRDKLINMQKREKLKGLLITKFMKKFGIKNAENFLQQEISKFLEGDVLSDADLKRLDEKLKKALLENEDNERLKRNLSSDNNQNYSEERSKVSEVILPELNKAETLSVYSKNSKMSGASHLSKFNERGVGQDAQADDDELDLFSMSSRKPLQRFDFSNEGDEWNAICQYNRKIFEEEKKLNKLKDYDLKRRTKEDLDNQIRQKLNRIHEEQLVNREYDQIQYAHTQYLNEIERQKQMEIKNKILKEKENRDKQMKDEKMRKKIELSKERKYDKELVKHLLAEIDKDKLNMIRKKNEEKEALHKTLVDNQLNKVRQVEMAIKEKEDDIRAAEEYGKILQKQENERMEYFKNIERNSHGYNTKAVAESMKEMEVKSKEEEEKMRQYIVDKEKRDQDEEEKKKIQTWQNKISMRGFLDMQIEERKKIGEFEKSLNSEQAKIWNMDAQRYYEQERETSEKVRQSHVQNNAYLKSQMELKKLKKASPKMSTEEYAINKNILETIKSI